MDLIFVYNDIKIEDSSIQDIFGERTFGSIQYSKNYLKNYIFQLVKDIFYDKKIEFQVVQNSNYNENLSTNKYTNKNIFIFNSNFVIKGKEVEILLKKLFFAELDTQIVSNNKVALKYYNSLNSFERFELKKNRTEYELITITDEINFSDLSVFNNCINFISGIYETRYFNYISGDENYIYKTSSDINKIKDEHDFYYLLPNIMQTWFIQPFDLKIESERATYSMERLQAANCALGWIHDSYNAISYEKLLDKLFLFLKTRSIKKVSKEEYFLNLNMHYVDKVKLRFNRFKETNIYSKINSIIKNSSSYQDLDEIYNKYYSLIEETKKNLEKKEDFFLAISHGDLCFSNILYDSKINLLKLIDPKGATTEKNLWTVESYDIAKLSHSILGNYDFINNNKFIMKFDKNLLINLEYIDFGEKYKLYKKEFIIRFKELGYSYKEIRIFELSLFLSMLPLHIDYENKILAFLFNAINIIEDIHNDFQE